MPRARAGKASGPKKSEAAVHQVERLSICHNPERCPPPPNPRCFRSCPRPTTFSSAPTSRPWSLAKAIPLSPKASAPCSRDSATRSVAASSNEKSLDLALAGLPRAVERQLRQSLRYSLRPSSTPPASSCTPIWAARRSRPPRSTTFATRRPPTPISNSIWRPANAASATSTSIASSRSSYATTVWTDGG